MEVTLWVFVVFVSSLILQSSAFRNLFGTSVKGHVLFCPKKYELFYGLLQHNTIKPEDSMNDLLARRKTSFQFSLNVKCVKQNDEATVFVYAPEGYLVDRLKFESKEDCDKLKDLADIVGQPEWVRDEYGYEEIEYTIMYTLVGEVPRCLARIYKLITFQYYIKLQIGKPQLMDCKEKTVIGDAEINYEKEELFPWGNYEIMDFIKDAEFVGEPSSITLKADSNIKLKCQQYTKKERKEDGSIQSTLLAIGYITYENLILERLFLDSCPVDHVEGVYINRLPKTLDPSYEKEFTLVFKTTKGPCFKISISYRFQLKFRPLKKTANIYRYNHREVNCPNVWNSDAAFNVKPPWRITKWFN
ncbi:uncharacterized protein LOC128988010 [Macrosteles quadrilineatus]|uniref:uncharacterized protein LOC128988010 n=1 Tax=Macrosteles quadrilineatus TaxID=74068 RepID=UPI0023E2F7C3|nr:uncharacterized protein LOC128988010 [Macrosteles quadrilineatus]